MKKKNKYPDYDLVPATTGIIIDGVYLRKDKQAIIISFAWGEDLRFRPVDEIIKK